MAQTHSIGPWYTTTKPDDLQGLICSDIDGANIAVSYDQRDAHLIAAAPELLTACIHAYDTLQNMTSEDFARGKDRSTRDLLADVIAKVTGERP